MRQKETPATRTGVGMPQAYTFKLRYMGTLLVLMKRHIALAGVSGRSAYDAYLSDLCDRFERVTASIPRQPLVWEGDYS
jgi:hypothetical protein